MQIIKTIDFNIYELLQENCDGNPTFVLSWIVTYFGYNFDNIFYQYRLVDYFICSHPLSVYFLSAVILIDQINLIIEPRAEDKVSLYFYYL